MGMRRRQLVLCVLAVVVVVVGCSGISPEPVGRTRSEGVRTLQSHAFAEFEPKLDKTLTPKGAEDIFGRPDKITGSGLIIYIYVLDDGREIWLAFPGYAPIVYAKVKANDGSIAELKLR
jgi:hypothetical protein